MLNVKNEIRWAVAFTIMSLAWMTLEKLSGLHDQYIDYHMYLTNLYFIPAAWMIVAALRYIKKNEYYNQMTFAQGLKSGLILSFFIALLSPVAQWIVSYVITPDYFDNVIKRSVELGYYPNKEEAAKFFNFKSYVINSAIFSFVFGVIVTVISMLFLKTKK